MNGRFAIFGIVVSVAAHAAVLLVLSLSSSGSRTSPPPAADAASAESSAEKASSPETSPAAAAPSAADADPPALSSLTDEPRSASTPSAQSESHRAVRRTTHPVRLPDAHPATPHEPAPTPEAEWVTYTVKKGDWLERLCKKAGCSVSEATRYNKTTYKKLSNLRIGQKIKLPKFKEE